MGQEVKGKQDREQTALKTDKRSNPSDSIQNYKKKVFSFVILGIACHIGMIVRYLQTVTSASIAQAPLYLW